MNEIDAQVEEHAANTPGGLTIEKKRILHNSLQKEEDFWERYVANEERPNNANLLDCE